MTIHSEVLRAAMRICRERGDWCFTPEEIVRALPELNANSVRTHIISRCCVNAPRNHPHKWEYFRRIRRGVYEVLAPVRYEVGGSEPVRVEESAPAYTSTPLRNTVHAVAFRGERAYVVECLEVAVVTQGGTLDEALANLREALALHFEGEDPATFGLTGSPRLVMTYESQLEHGPTAQTADR